LSTTLLDVSAHQPRQDRAPTERVELARIIEQAVEASRALTAAMEPGADGGAAVRAVYLNADPTRLAQSSGNLLNNAMQVHDVGGRISLAV
jgi:C4-dicarboxylate-specific signal transduction histidine kinase